MTKSAWTKENLNHLGKREVKVLIRRSKIPSFMKNLRYFSNHGQV
jgi:hypothetical protein